MTEILKPENKSKNDAGRDYGDTELRFCSRQCRQKWGSDHSNVYNDVSGNENDDEDRTD